MQYYIMYLYIVQHDKPVLCNFPNFWVLDGNLLRKVRSGIPRSQQNQGGTLGFANCIYVFLLQYIMMRATPASTAAFISFALTTTVFRKTSFMIWQCQIAGRDLPRPWYQGIFNTEGNKVELQDPLCEYCSFALGARWRVRCTVSLRVLCHKTWDTNQSDSLVVICI